MTRQFMAAPWEWISSDQEPSLLASIIQRLPSDHALKNRVTGVTARRTDREDYCLALGASLEQVMRHGLAYAVISFASPAPFVRAEGPWEMTERIIIQDSTEHDSSNKKQT